jgi:hypothetical protein
MLVIKKIDESILVWTGADVSCDIAWEAGELAAQPGILPGDPRVANTGFEKVCDCHGAY